MHGDPFIGNVFPAFNFMSNLLEREGKFAVFVFLGVSSFGIEVEDELRHMEQVVANSGESNRLAP
jgi:hypothetical protein